ncbi:hypothetical protein [Gemmatimonas sp.]|uniref:hypothetical protein n=1 Tax=Gemmatimonas sp. TaxID=1962908 RepID=UPI003DA27A02
MTPPGSRGPASMGAPWPGVRRTGSAGSAVGEDLVDHRRLGDECDDAHGAVAAGTRERVDLEDLLKQGRPPADASVGASGRAGTITGGPSAPVGAAFWRMPRGRLAYQP